MRIAYLIDPPGSLNGKSDSTVELIRTHSNRGDEVHAVLRDGVICDSDDVRLECFPIEVQESDDNWFDLSPPASIHASELDAIFIRLEPPVNDSYAKICQVLEIAKRKGVKVVNDPISIVTKDEKISTLVYPELIPPTMVSTNKAALLEFITSFDSGFMLKPIGKMGGQGVFSFGNKDSNVKVALDLMINDGQTVLVQKRLDGISEGDRRVFVIGGKPYSHMLNRVPSEGSHLGNMVAGGIAQAMEIGDDERRIAEAIGSDLLQSGIMFAGLDVIDGHLTEVNITCPTGLRTIRDQTGLCPAQDVIDAIPTSK